MPSSPADFPNLMRTNLARIQTIAEVVRCPITNAKVIVWHIQRSILETMDILSVCYYIARNISGPRKPGFHTFGFGQTSIQHRSWPSGKWLMTLPESFNSTTLPRRKSS